MNDLPPISDMDPEDPGPTSFDGGPDGYLMLTPDEPQGIEDAEDRQPPISPEAEQALLAAILANEKVLEKVSDFLLPEHFCHPGHALIYRSCLVLSDRGHLVNPVTLKPYLTGKVELEDLGGVRYLAKLVGAVVTIINAETYGRIIHDLYLRRCLIGLGTDMVNDAFAISTEESDTATAQIEKAEQVLFDLATTGDADGGPKDFRSAVINAINMAEMAHKRDGDLAGVPTKLMDLDKKLGGLHDSDLLILAGRPSMGKTALGTAMAFNAARHYHEQGQLGEPSRAVVFFSLEMSAEQLATRIISEQSEVSSHKLRTGELSNEDFDRVVSVSSELHQIPLFIDDTPALSVSAMRTRCRRLARTFGGSHGNGLGLIIVDYLQLLSPGRGERSDNRVQEVSAITRGLKALAKELNVPVLALSQLSRQVEQRDDKRPQLADLRESGSIEQDADVVMFIFREQYYLERSEPMQKPEEGAERYQERYDTWRNRCEAAHNVAEVIVAKQRHGPIGSVELFFDGQYTRFDNLVRDEGRDALPAAY